MFVSLCQTVWTSVVAAGVCVWICLLRFPTWAIRHATISPKWAEFCRNAICGVPICADVCRNAVCERRIQSWATTLLIGSFKNTKICRDVLRMMFGTSCAKSAIPKSADVCRNRVWMNIIAKCVITVTRSDPKSTEFWRKVVVTPFEVCDFNIG